MPLVLDGAVNYLRSGATEFVSEAKTALQLGELYPPGDAGVLAALLLNRISLKPGGRGIYLPAGNLHAYLHGMGGFEVMANSDNVLRGGLTPSTSTCQSCCGSSTSPPPTSPNFGHGPRARESRSCTTRRRPEFAVSMLRLDGDDLGHEIDAPARHDGPPQVLFCTEGRFRSTRSRLS